MAHADAAPRLASGVFRPATVRGVEGFFRAGQTVSGNWWLIEPGGAPFFAKAVHGICGTGEPGGGALDFDSFERLRAWGFNAAGVPGDEAGRDDGLPFLAVVDFCRAAPPIVAPGLRLPDVFDPAWPQCAAAHAREVCGPWAEHTELIGWVTDDDPGWAQPSLAGRPSLLQICLSLEPCFAAYHAAWEFVLALHGGRLEWLAEAWNADVPNRESVRELTRAEEGLGTRGYLRDAARWTRELARRYFTTTAAAVRASDPNHLVFGCRIRRPVGAHVLAECVYPAVDVAVPHWSELPPAGARPSQPVLAGDVGWVQDDFVRAPAGNRTRRLTTVERMLRRARATLDRVARHPAAVGYVWAQWQDEPAEQPPFARGLVHVNGAEAREHTEVLVPFNGRAELLRRAADAPVSG